MVRALYMACLCILCTGIVVAQGEWDIAGFPDSRITRIAQHPSDTALMYTAIDDSVYRSTDGGETWTYAVSFNDLPVNDLQFHPVDPDGPGTMADFEGESTLGTWTLSVQDTIWGVFGQAYLNGFTLHVTADGGFDCDLLTCPEPTPSSMPPKVPISASTVTPRACAYSTTDFVTATFSS